ncbi:MAG TPA: FtsW/RodA/SpoVE family cell cycle protein, partial [bacterium]|nr:FtsW/RodA/SpoVE family cell cycle protein [bacterium]
MFDRRLIANFDWWLFLNTLVIALIGIAAIYSASKGYSSDAKYWLRQFYWIGLGLAAGFFVLLVDMRTIGRWSYLFHAVVIVALVAVLRHGVGGSGSQVERWFMVGGLAIQPSEFAKFSTVLAIAYYFRDNRRVGNLGIRGILIPLLITAIPFVLIVEQPDLGTAMLLMLLFVPMIVLAGVRLRLLAVLGAVGIVVVVALVASFNVGYYRVDRDVLASLRSKDVPAVLIASAAATQGKKFWSGHAFRAALTQKLDLDANDPFVDQVTDAAFRPMISYALRPYQRKRLITFVNPDADPLGAGYHVIQSKVAIGSGEFWGKGFGRSTQGALNFLPARHTDFIFAI